MKEYYDRVPVAFIHDEKCFGTVEKLGAYASTLRYVKNGDEVLELLDNEDFIIVDEIVFQHIEEGI